MPDTITAFDKEAFSGCKGLKTVYISASVKNIPERAFYKCRGMESVLLPEGIQKIGEEAFYFASIKELSIPSTVVSIKDKAFFTSISFVPLVFSFFAGIWGDSPG